MGAQEYLIDTNVAIDYLGAAVYDSSPFKISISTFCLKTKSSKKFKKIRCFNPQARTPSPDFQAIALQPSAD